MSDALYNSSAIETGKKSDVEIIVFRLLLLLALTGWRRLFPCLPLPLPSSRFLYRPSSISDGFKTITWGQSRSRNMLPGDHHFQPQERSVSRPRLLQETGLGHVTLGEWMGRPPSSRPRPPPNNSISPKIIARFLDRSPDVNLMSAKSGSIDGREGA